MKEILEQKIYIFSDLVADVDSLTEDDLKIIFST